MAKKDVFAPVDTDHPAFRSWFGKSVLHDNGVPRTYYHGTSKDADFKKFKMSRHGVWMTTDPEEASKYAIENDSQGFRRDGWDMKRVNTASRVIPVHARIEKPFVGEMPKEYLQENYKKSQSDWFDALRSNGYDGWVPKSQNGKLAVALAHPGQIKSALSNTGDYSETGDINKAEGGSVKDYIPHDDPRRAQNLAKFLEGNHPNVPDEVFHSSKADVRKFDPKKRGQLSPFGFHFGTADQANFRTGQYDFESPAPNVGKYHLSMKNPLEVSHMASFAPDHLADHMMDIGILDPDHYDRLNEKHNYEPIPVGSELVKILKKNGYDGLMYQNEREGEGYSFVPFDANQIKSATGNDGNFNPEKQEIDKAAGGSVDDQPQRDLSPLGLYSHAAEMASQLPQDRGSPQQMAGVLVNKYGVKPVEMEGFDEAFAGQPTVTRDQLVQHFKSKMPQIEEKVLGVQPQGVPYPEEYQKIEQSIIDKYSPEMARHHAIYNDRSNDQSVRNEAFQNVEKLRDQMWSEIDQAIPNREELLEKANPRTTPTKFEKYTLPGGENYREVLLKLPAGFGAPKQALDDLAAATDRYKDLEKRHNDELEARLTGETSMSYEDFLKLTRDKDVAKARVKNFEKIVNQPIFQSSHWEEPDVVAHLRMSDRTGLSGEKILHVEEIQSDWGQKGREEGFAKNLDPKILDQLGEEQSSAMFRLEDAREAFNNTYENIFKENLKSAFKDAPTEYDLQNALKMHDEVIKSNHPQKRFDEYKSNFLRMPDSFTPEQHSLLQDAYDAHLEARDAYNAAKDKMAEYRSSSKGVPAGPYVTKTADWTDLALKRALKEAADGGYDKLIWTPGEEQAKRYDLSKQVKNVYYDPELQGGTLAAEGLNGQTVLDKSGIKPEKIADYIGKEAAKKLLAQERNVNGHHVLEGDGLKVGGEGMKGYYDKIVPTQLQKLVKKLDPEAKIGKERINGPGGPIQEILDRAGITRDEWIELGDTGRDAIRKQYGTGPEFQSLEITPKMREAVKRGLPAFASGGAVDEDEDEGITAYHGSPYDFPKFDISKIGTGEGNATYGHGLYFAGNEDVAKSYRDQLRNKSLIDENAPLSDAKRAAGELFDSWQGNLEGALDDAKYYSNAKEVISELKKIGANPPKGHMYEVRIKAHPDHFLDWDEVLEDQNDYIKSILPRIADRDRKEKGWSDLDDHLQEPDAYTGGAFYRSLAQRGREKEASEILSQMGIKGIRYKDAASRFKNGEPSYNYVVFNHDHVDIKRKYARGGAISGVKKQEPEPAEYIEKGSVKHTYVHPSSDSYLSLVTRPTGRRSASIIDLYVPEEHRNKGIAKTLLKAAMNDFPNMQGQVSSKIAAKNAYSAGRRMAGNEDASLEEIYKAIDENSSVNMWTPDK